MTIVTDSIIPPYEEGIVPYSFNFTPYDELTPDQLIVQNFVQVGNFVPGADLPAAVPEPGSWLCLVAAFLVYCIYGLTRGRKSSAYS